MCMNEILCAPMKFNYLSYAIYKKDLCFSLFEMHAHFQV